ncbi:MAG: DUF1588 domain-containing protein [Roseibacillus sp.]
MRKLITPFLAWVITATLSAAPSLSSLLEENCFECHNDKKSKGKFKILHLGDAPTEENLDRWLDCLDLVDSEEMPPEEDSNLSALDRASLIALLEAKLDEYNSKPRVRKPDTPRRLNNREFANSVRDALLLEHIGTNDPVDNLIADNLYHGFDTHSETLGFSRFHLEQYMVAIRKIVDATILSGEQPPAKHYHIPAEDMRREQLRQVTVRDLVHSVNGTIDLSDPSLGLYFETMRATPSTGFYRIKIRAAGIDRGYYPQEKTGIWDDDPIQLKLDFNNLGFTFDLPDEEPQEFEIRAWLAEGTRLRLSNPTDGLRMRGNGNFKFQNAIAGEFTKKNEPERYARIVAKIKSSGGRERVTTRPDFWPNWVAYWRGPRPRVYSAEIEGPLFDSWPPQRQVSLIGENPSAENASEILLPIAQRAWRRSVQPNELSSFVQLVQSRAPSIGDLEAIKDGIVAIFASPSFLFINGQSNEPSDHFRTKLSYLLRSSLPERELQKESPESPLNSFEDILAHLKKESSSQRMEEFLDEFPNAWFELDDINFMSPDPANYPYYHKKKLSQDMVGEAKTFFRHIIENNLPVTEFLTADYSFINADLAEIYQVTDIPSDSKFRKYVFTDGRRGGLLGMGAFLTSTADSLSTSPIHRAVYVMENFLGIHPTPPPADVKITEPDVRQAKTIKEILAAHTSDVSCASCHATIDPYGYAFENFDPTGAWREHYTLPSEEILSEEETPKRKRNRPKIVAIPIDTSAQFRSGDSYQDITEFRAILQNDLNRERFVKSFVEKLLLYSNGAEPDTSDFAEIDQILLKSAAHDYRIIETLAAVIDSPLFHN